MPHARGFGEWFDRVRGGDPDAGAEFVLAFTPVVRKFARARLARLGLSQFVDPADVCQTVLVGFFARLTAAWPPVGSAEQLTAFLLTIARNKIADESRRHAAGRRLHRDRTADSLLNVASPAPSPGAVVAGNELYELALRLLSAEELELLEDRLGGADWRAIAADRGVPAGVLRQKLSRAVRRVRSRLGE